MAATQAQINAYNIHQSVCNSLGIQQSTLAHRGLRGSETPQSTTGNIVYTDPPPKPKFDDEYLSKTLVWLVTLTFIRGEERRQDEGPAVISVPLLQGQIPAIDDNSDPILIAQDDLILDVNTPWIYRIANPAISPDGGFWTVLLERLR